MESIPNRSSGGARKVTGAKGVLKFADLKMPIVVVDSS
jgi:hypothetical protein